LNSIDGVLDGVFVVPQEEGAVVTRLAAYVVAPGLTAEAVMEGLRQRIDPAFLPRPLCLVEFLPRNATGKLPREPLGRIAGGPGQP
jgi:acyl-coenzyme A synthetase/AMP-(fatty) acid ligase